jgi:hypothetical protein
MADAQKQQLIQYSKDVADEAKSYEDSIDQAKADANEEESLSHMFAPGYDGEGRKLGDSKKAAPSLLPQLKSH